MTYQTPIENLIDATDTPGTPNKLFLTEDPALIILYRQIRDKTLKTLRGAEKIPKGAEFQFVLHTARLYDRMGCDLLALDLGKPVLFDSLLGNLGLTFALKSEK